MISLQQFTIEQWFDERIIDISTISQLPAVKEMNKDKMQQVFELFDHHYTEFNGIVYVNKNGISEIDTGGPIGCLIVNIRSPEREIVC